MKKKAVRLTSKKNILNLEFSSWNFIIFLSLAFILIVFVALAMSNTAADLSAKAGLSCPQIKDLPRPEACPGGVWKFKRDAQGCRAFFCDPTVPTPVILNPSMSPIPVPQR